MQARPDLDTVCAFDYVKMKNYALNGEGLSYADFHPEAKGITIPKLEWSPLNKALFEKISIQFD